MHKLYKSTNKIMDFLESCEVNLTGKMTVEEKRKYVPIQYVC
jgi:hypothetical protein